MAVSTVSSLVWIALLTAFVGYIFLGGIGLLVGIVLIGVAVAALEGEMEYRINPRPPEPPHPMRYACPSCGGDAYAGEPFCSSCGIALPGLKTRSA